MQTLDRIERKLQDLQVWDGHTTALRILVLELMNHILIEYVTTIQNMDKKTVLTGFVTELQDNYSVLKQLEKNAHSIDRDITIDTIREKVIEVIIQIRPIVAAMSAKS